MLSTIHDARLEALFASLLQESQRPTAAEVKAAVRDAVHRFGVRGCASQVAGEFGDHPDRAVLRMAWCNCVVDETWPARGAR